MKAIILTLLLVSSQAIAIEMYGFLVSQTISGVYYVCVYDSPEGQIHRSRPIRKGICPVNIKVRSVMDQDDDSD
jgi:hypothetical protein